MKKILSNLICILLSFSFLIAQNVPQGINYQAVARDAEGQLIAEQPISVQISLIGNIERKEVVYSEIHNLETNKYGLFDFVIGQGESLDGSFEEIPWESEEIWLEVAMDAKAGEDYKVMNTTKLLTVPYAFHAGSANELVPINPEDGRVPWWGQPWWNIEGLEKTNPDKHFVGNIDSVDLVFRTNNQERMRVKADGDICVSSDTFSVKYLEVKSDQEHFMATFENLNDGDGDGIKIKLGKTRPVGPEIGPDIPIFIGPLQGVVTKTQLVVDAVLDPGTDELLDLFASYLDPNAVFASAEQAEFFASTLCFMSQGIINAGLQGINDGLGLPFGSRDILVGVNGCDPYPNPNPNIDLCDTDSTGNNLALINDSWIPGPGGGFEIIPEIQPIDICGLLFTPYELPEFPDLSLNVSSLSMANEFISFADKNDNRVGAIKGINAYEFANSYIDDFLILDVSAEVIGVDPLAAMAQGINQVAKLSKKYNELGVEYSSGHGDYAEWLERQDPNERISTGDIVAVKGGKITKDLRGAEQIMAVSHRPIVLGNIPTKGQEHLGNNIAFMGQIPVKVMGPIESGDYIIANPEVPGYGFGLSEEEMTIADLKLAVGRSWETNLTNGPKMVNTVIGVPSGDYVKFLESYEQKILTTEARMEAVESKLDMLSELISKEGKTN